MRIKLKDLSIKRIIEALSRRISAFPESITWFLNLDKFFDKNKLKQYENLHKGERCFLIANGPSLKNTDLSLLKNEKTLGMNRIYLLFDELQFKTTYYTVTNDLVIQQFKDDIQKIQSQKFVNWSFRHLFTNREICYLKMKLALEDGFSKDITKGIYTGGTVTYASLQLLYYMGFSEVIIIGLDHNFSDKGQPNKTEVRTAETDANHFHPNYFPKGIKWQLPDLYRSELAYAKARKAFEADGRRILDATIGGHCTVFEKVDYYSLFKQAD